MAYAVYLDGERLPITPSEIRMKHKNLNHLVTLVNGGEYNFLSKRGLCEITFNALFPQTKYPYSVYPNGFKNADYFLRKLNELKENMKVFTFTYIRTGQNGKLLFDTNMYVNLEEYTIVENAENGSDIEVSITLREASAEAALYENMPNKEDNDKRVSDDEAGKGSSENTYTVKSGDTLWYIAKRYLGDGSRYREIYELNKDILKSPSLIYPGQTLRIK